MIVGRRLWMSGAALALGVSVGARPVHAAAGVADLSRRFAQIEAAQGGRLGVAVLDTGTGLRAGHRQDERFPIGSTFKLLAAGAVLTRADARRDSMDRRLRFSREELVIYSPATEKRTGGDGMTLAELCDAAITLSDNTAGNLLLGVLGGPAGLTAFLRGLGDDVTRLDRMETALNEATPGDLRDTTSPAAMLADIEVLTVGDGLSAPARRMLLEWLRHNRTGNGRLRARLPLGWQAGEKTGTSAHETSNDVGLLWPADGAAPVLVAAYLTQGASDGTARDAALADVGASVAAAFTR